MSIISSGIISSDYDPLELVQESINENLFSEIVNEEAFRLSENNQQLLNDSTNYNKCEKVSTLHTKTNIQLNNIICDIKKMFKNLFIQ